MTGRSDLERRTYEWPNDNWGWSAAALVGLLILGGVALGGRYDDHPRTASLPDDATTGQRTRPPAQAVAPARSSEPLKYLDLPKLETR